MLAREEFGRRFRMAYLDPLFDDAKDAIAQIEEIAWQRRTSEAANPRSPPGRGRALPIRTSSCRSNGWIPASDCSMPRRYGRQPKVRRACCWSARLDRYIGYHEPYATRHETLDRDEAVQQETRNVGHAVMQAVTAMRSGQLQPRRQDLRNPRPK